MMPLSFVLLPADRRVPAAACALMTFSLACDGPQAPPTDWPSWRGPGADGLSASGPLPAAWSSEGRELTWAAEIPGRGNSTPVVADGRVFVTWARDADTASAQDSGLFWRAVGAWDLSSGSKLWEQDLFRAPEEHRHQANTMAAPSAVLTGDSVYVYFGSTAARLRQTTGEIVWQREVDPDYSTHSRYAAASSPAVADHLLVLFQDREVADTTDRGWLMALDRETGETTWRREWDHTCCSYTTPLVVDRGSGLEVLVAFSGELVSYAAETGEPLWSLDYQIAQLVSTPVLVGDLLVVVGGAHGVRSNLVARLSGSGADTTAEVLWEDIANAPQNASPVVADGLLFTVTDQGVLTCRDLLSGEIRWRERLDQSRNRASPVIGDGKLFLQSGGRSVTTVRASDTFELLAVNELAERGSNASPAVAGDCLLIRTRKRLLCIDREADTRQAGPSS